MPDVPNILLIRLKSTLQKCREVFFEQLDLWNTFDDPRIKLWQDDLQESHSMGQRIERTISYLAGKANKQGQSALSLLLLVLADRYHADDERCNLLQTLADQLQSITSLTQQLRDNPLLGEANPSRIPMTHVTELENQKTELEQILKCARAVCLIEVPRYRNRIHEGNGGGTGWLLASGLVITCWHVITAQLNGEPQPEDFDIDLQVKRMILHFDYTQIGKGLEYRVAKLLYRPTDPQEQDFALLRLEKKENYPFSLFSYLPLAPELAFKSQIMLPIIQHPLGQVKQIAFGRFVNFADKLGRIHYDTGTEPGTSGSPVLSRPEWQVVALHNGENETQRLREGTTIDAILNELQAHAPDLYDEIIKAQNVLTKPLPPPDEYIQTPAEITDSIHNDLAGATQKQRPFPRISPYEENKFQRRPEEFEALLGKLLNRENGAPRIALVGMGGRGKTRLAYEIVKRVKEQGSFPDNVYWMIPEEANKLPISSDEKAKRYAWEADFARFAVESNYVPPNNNEHPLEKNALRARYICDYFVDHAGTLIVFDNVEDPEYAVNAIGRISGEAAKCAILYTSQRRARPPIYDGTEVYLHEVEELSEEGGCNLLLEKRPELLEAIRSGKNDSEMDAVRTILNAVENLPLTLMLLGSLLEDDKDYYTSLLPLVDDLKALGQVGTLDPMERAKAALRRVFALRWERIESEDARRLLQLMSYYPIITAIPLNLLNIAMGKKEGNYLDNRSFRQAKIDLQKWSLVETPSTDEVRLHSLICELTKKQVEANGDGGKTLRGAAASHLFFAFTKLNNLAARAQHLGYWQCLNLVKAALRYAQALDSEHAEGLSRVATWLQYEGHLLGDGAFWPELLPELLYQQLYNHFIEEDGLHSQEDPPEHWIRLAESNGGKNILPLWTQNFPSYASIKRLMFSPDTRQIALAFYTASEDKTSILFYDSVTGHASTLITVDSPVSLMNILFTSDNKRIIAGNASGHFTVWDTINGQLIEEYDWEPDETLTCLAFSPDATTAAAGTKRGLVYLYNLEHHKEAVPLLCSDTTIEEVVFSHDGRILAARTADHVSLWDWVNERCLYQYELASTCLVFSPDDIWLALGGSDGHISLQEIPGLAVQKKLSKDTSPVTCLAFSTDSTELVVGQENAVTRIWGRRSIERGVVNLLAELPDRKKQITHVAVSPDNTCVITAGKAGKLYAWDKAKIRQSQQQSEQVENLVFSSNGATVLALTNNQQLKQWKRDGTRISETLLLPLAGQTEHFMCLANHQQSKRFSLGTSLGRIWLGNTEHPEDRVQLGQHKKRVTCLAFSPDGGVLATGSNDGTVHLYDVATGLQIRALLGNSGSIDCLAFTPDSTRLITSSSNGVFSFWSIATDICLEPLPRQELIIRHLCISSDGEALVAGTCDGKVYAWVETGSGYSEPVCFSSPTSSEIVALTCAPWGKVLIICYSNHQTDFVQLAELPERKLRLIGKVTTACPIKAIYWQDHRNLILAGADELVDYPRFYQFVLEGNWIS